MVRRLTLTICLLTGCIWCFAMVSRVDSAQPGAAFRPFKPVASVHGLMYGQGLLFKKLNEELAKKDDPERFEHIEAYSEALAELANVNSLNSDKLDYQGLATKLRDTAIDLSKEAKKSDASDARMNKLLTKLKKTCRACHDAHQ